MTADSRPTIRKGALEVLFDILVDHGNLFSGSFWINIFKSVINPMFSRSMHMIDQVSPANSSKQPEEDYWNSETDIVAVQCLADLLLKFFDVLRHQLGNVVEILVSFIRSPYQQSANTGVTGLLHLLDNVGKRLSETEWREVMLLLKKATALTLPVFSRIVDIMDKVEVPNRVHTYSDAEQYSDNDYIDDDEEDANMEAASYVVVRMTGHIAVQLLIVKVFSSSPFAVDLVLISFHKQKGFSHSISLIFFSA